jgi:hypothetical protein
VLEALGSILSMGKKKKGKRKKHEFSNPIFS